MRTVYKVVARIIVGVFACVVASISFHALAVWLRARAGESLGERVIRALMCEALLVLCLFSFLAACCCFFVRRRWAEAFLSRHATRAALYAGLCILLTIVLLLVFL